MSDSYFPLSLQIKSDGQEVQKKTAANEKSNEISSLIYSRLTSNEESRTKWCNKNPTGTSNSVVPGFPNPLSHSRAAPGFIFARGESLESWKHYVDRIPSISVSVWTLIADTLKSNHWSLSYWWSQIHSWGGLTNKDSTPFCIYDFLPSSIEKTTVTSHQNGWLVWILILACYNPFTTTYYYIICLYISFNHFFCEKTQVFKSFSGRYSRALVHLAAVSEFQEFSHFIFPAVLHDNSLTYLKHPYTRKICKHVTTFFLQI